MLLSLKLRPFEPADWPGTIAMAAFSGNRVRLDVTLAIGMTANTSKTAVENRRGVSAGVRLHQRGDRRTTARERFSSFASSRAMRGGAGRCHCLDEHRWWLRARRCRHRLERYPAPGNHLEPHGRRCRPD